MALLDRYRYNLEDVIRERTEALDEERRRNESLLLQLLPRSVAECLKNGKPVEAEHYSAVTIYFSDIAGFTALSSKSTPMQVVDMLNDLYTIFDTIISEFDVYKVETIGDAYMYVSGLPEVNGNNHAGEVCAAALGLLSSITTFKIRHCPDEKLQLRIGIHTGPVVTGVVGVKMPRYCLFGDTVLRASKMESTGEPMKIQVSETTNKILEHLHGYETQFRKSINPDKDPGMNTFWLLGYDKAMRDKRMIKEAEKWPHLEPIANKLLHQQ